MAAWVLVLLLIVVFRPAITVLLVAALLLAGPPGGCLGGAVGAVVLPGAGFLVGFAVVVSGVCVSLSHLVRCHTSTHSSYNVACSASACVGDHFRLDGKDRLE